MMIRFHPFLALTLMAASLCAISRSARAQSVGYLTGTVIQSFDPATGAILKTLTQESLPGPTVVSPDGTKLYSPVNSQLQILSAADGSLLAAIPGLSRGPRQTLLSPSGRYIYEMSAYIVPRKEWIAVVDLMAGKVVHYIHVSPGFPTDIALSPDGKKLFVSSQKAQLRVAPDSESKPDTSGVPVSICPLGNGICVFDTTTFALTGHVLGTTGYLAISQDGKSLYAWMDEITNPVLTFVDTDSLVVSSVAIPQGLFADRVTVAPVGNQAVIFAVSVGGAMTASYTLDTLTNQFTGSIPAPPIVEFYALQNDLAAFSPDGTSLWNLGTCIGSPGCTVLVGQRFPSGEVIAQTPITQVGGASAVTF